MSGAGLSGQERLKWITAAAAVAAEAERKAVDAKGFGLEVACWQQFDGAVATLLGLILSPEGVEALDAMIAHGGGVA